MRLNPHGAVGSIDDLVSGSAFRCNDALMILEEWQDKCENGDL